MIYAINKWTKEHVAHPDKRISEVRSGLVIAEDGWVLLEADADGWIAWDGDECPLPDGGVTDVRYIYPQGKELHRLWPAEDAEWWEVIAYRPILDADPSEPDAPEWDGQGRPPIGAEIELRRNDNDWIKGLVVGYDGLRVACRVDYANYKYQSAVGGGMRPIRTPAQRAEDEAVAAMADAMRGTEVASTGRAQKINATAIYAAIRDGKIPGVKLEGE